MTAEPLRIRVGGRAGEVSGLLLRAPESRRLLVLAHGAGAGMRHPFMEEAALRLAEHRTSTLRYDFPYMEAGRRLPDARAVLLETVRAVAQAGAAAAPRLPLLAGGKSMGGRMTSEAAAAGLIPAVRGLVFLGFPLHPAGRPSRERADHLGEVAVPMLFVQGTRDRLAGLDLLGPEVRALGPRASLHLVENGDHSFHLPRRSGRTEGEVLDGVARAVAGWAGVLEAAGNG